jgi:hypothetical protein
MNLVVSPQDFFIKFVMNILNNDSLSHIAVSSPVSFSVVQRSGLSSSLSWLESYFCKILVDVTELSVFAVASLISSFVFCY